MQQHLCGATHIRQKQLLTAATMMMMKMKKIFHYTRQYNLWSSNDCDIGRMVVCSKSKISKVLVPVFALKELNFEHVVVVVVVCTISLCCCCSCWCYCCWFQIDDVYYVRSLAHICANRVKKTKVQSARARAKDPVWYSQCMWRSHIDLVHLLLCVRACVRWLYSFHGACSFNDWATRYVFARCACVCAFLSECDCFFISFIYICVGHFEFSLFFGWTVCCRRTWCATGY